MATVAVVGLGLMGGSFALALKRARPETTLVGVDSDQATLRKALERGVVTIAGPDLGPARAADVVMLAVPVLAMRPLLKDLAGVGGVVTDMASTKSEVMRWAAVAGLELVGGHPMCGREASGIDAADPDLFQGAPWVLTRAQPEVEALVDAVGARPVVMDAETHDRLVAGVSHAAFVLSAAYVLSVAGAADWTEAGRLAASGFRDMSRLAGGEAGMYAGIARTNRQELGAALDRFEAALARIRRHIEHDDPRLGELFEEARAARERWLAGDGQRP